LTGLAAPHAVGYHREVAPLTHWVATSGYCWVLNPCGSAACGVQNFGQHGREIITSDVALRLLELLSLGAKVRGL
jgi:hypothetical protein